MKMIITTWDKSSHILKNFAFMADKYIPEFEVEILGYNIFPHISRNFKCISVENLQRFWASDYYAYMRTITDEYVIFGTDDLLINRPVDYEVFDNVMEQMQKDNEICRYELGTGHCWHTWINFIKNYPDWNIYEYGKGSEYRISTQLSVWRTEYLLKYLNHQWTPWQFELEGSKLANTDGKMIIATKGRYAFGYTHCLSTQRYPGLVNVEGIKEEDI